MVNTGLEHFCSMPREWFQTGGRPTLEVRFSVRLYVAEKYTPEAIFFEGFL